MPRNHRPGPRARRVAALAGPPPHPPWPPRAQALAGLLCLLCLLALRAPTAAEAAVPSPDGRQWPVREEAAPGRGGPPTIERGFLPPPSPWAAGHRGVDLAARAGQPVRAVAAGRVTFAGRVAGRGVVSLVLAGVGGGSGPLRTTYEPVRALVSEGERVAAGQVVGVLEDGPYHCSRPCLHWGLLRGGRYVDPLSLFPWVGGGPRPRLLPVLGVPLPEGPSVVGPPTHSGDPHDRSVAASSSVTPEATVAALLALAVGATWSRGALRRAARGRRRTPRQEVRTPGRLGDGLRAHRRWPAPRPPGQGDA